MKITKLILPLVLGLTGGLIAIFITDGLKSENKQPVLQHDIVGPGMTRVVHNPQQENTGIVGSVDLREAA